MKYPLTETAKAAARTIVEAWDDGTLKQKFGLSIFSGGGRESGSNGERSRCPQLSLTVVGDMA